MVEIKTEKETQRRDRQTPETNKFYFQEVMLHGMIEGKQ